MQKNRKEKPRQFLRGVNRRYPPVILLSIYSLPKNFVHIWRISLSPFYICLYSLPLLLSLKKRSSEAQRIWNQKKKWGLTKRMMEYRRPEITWFSLTTLLAMASAMPLVLSRFKFSIQSSLIKSIWCLITLFCFYCWNVAKFSWIYLKNTLMKFWDRSEIWMGCDGDMSVGGSAADSGGAWCARGDWCSWFCFHLWDSVPSPLHSQGHLTTFCLFP